jgi:hypothetical protein
MTTIKKQLNPLQLGVWIAAIAILAYGIYQVIQLYWVCDDAFISFRYAKNLVNGLGLVYNAGEHVEGYTNFLWTVIIALGFKLNFEPILFSNILGALSYFGTVAVFGWLSYRLFSTGRNEGKLFLPLAAMAVLLHHDCHVFATSGLETSFDMFLVSVGFFLLLQLRNERSPMWAGLALLMAAATRPDSMAFYVMGAAFLFITVPKPWKSLFWYLAPMVLLYLPYWIIRYSYYGWPFPNTYYAKSADLPYYSQGFTYISLYFRSYYVLLLAPIGLIAAVVVNRKQPIAFRNLSPSAKALLLGVLFCGPYTFYVLRSGGDFMFARFFIPITPLLFFMIETQLRLLVSKARVIVPVAAVILCLLILRWNPFAHGMQRYIANEHDFYPASFIQRAQDIGGKMKQYFAGTNARIAIMGMYAMYAYYSEAPVVIEANAGLTDEFTAHQPLLQRGRPGHEKAATREYLMSRKVNFMIRGGVKPSRPLDSLTCIYFDDFPAYIMTFDNELMDHLKQFPTVKFRDIRPVIDGLIREYVDLHERRVLESYPFLKAYYFDVNNDPAREQVFIDAYKQ